MKTLPLLPALVAILLPSALSGQTAEETKEEGPPDRYVPLANQVLVQAGLPPLPSEFEEMECYAWSRLSAGIYAAFELKKEAFDGYVAPYLSSMEHLTPIPRRLLTPPNSAAPWFTPGSIRGGTVFFRGRITRAAPEIFRLYVDQENQRIFLYYTWNNKRTYP